MTQESPDDPPDTAQSSHAPDAVRSLKQAMRRARFDDAERVGAVADVHETKIGRLELLMDALKPLLLQIPRDVDMFDFGIMPGPTPRLFIDMIGFVEMGRDARVYRFLQDTRHNRITIAESSNVPTMVGAVTDYVARRLLEREKALASDALTSDALAWQAYDREVRDATPPAGTGAREPAPLRPGDVASSDALQRPRRPPKRDRTRPGTIGRAAYLGGVTFAFLIDLLGAIAFFSILAFGAWLLWNHVRG